MVLRLLSVRAMYFESSNLQELQYAMRRAGQNPTDVEVQDMVNKIDDGSGTLDFNDFVLVMGEKSKESSKSNTFLTTIHSTILNCSVKNIKNQTKGRLHIEELLDTRRWTWRLTSKTRSEFLAKTKKVRVK